MQWDLEFPCIFAQVCLPDRREAGAPVGDTAQGERLWLCGPERGPGIAACPESTGKGNQPASGTLPQAFVLPGGTSLPSP